jgi:hypothetical protein
MLHVEKYLKRSETIFLGQKVMNQDLACAGKNRDVVGSAF